RRHTHQNQKAGHDQGRAAHVLPYLIPVEHGLKLPLFPQVSLKVTLKVRNTLIGWPLKRAGSYFQAFTAATAALAKGSSPRTTLTRSTLPSARMTISSTPPPVRPSARASSGYGGIALLLFGRGGIASSGSSIGPPATPPTTPPSVVPPSRPAGSCLSPSPWTAIPLSSSGLASGGG